MGGAENGAANGEKEVKKQDSHTEHRDDFVASVGLSTAGWILQGARRRGPVASFVVPAVVFRAAGRFPCPWLLLLAFTLNPEA